LGCFGFWFLVFGFWFLVFGFWFLPARFFESMMLSGEPAIHRVPGPWVVLVFGFWFFFGRFSAGRT